MREKKNMACLVESSGLFVSVSGELVLCDNPVCDERAVVKDSSSGHWLCQHCHDEIYDTLWGIGHEMTLI